MKTTATLAAVAASVATASATSVTASPNNITLFTVGQGNTVNWTQAWQSPNATGATTFSGPDVSTASAGDAVPGWTLSVAVQANAADSASNGSIAATSFNVAEPPSLAQASAVGSSYSMCVSLLGRVSSKKSFRTGSFGDDDCTGALGSDCVADLLRAAMEDNIPCNLQLPESCSKLNTDDGVFSAGVNAINMTNSVFFGWATEDVTYDLAAAGTWPVLLRWQNLTLSPYDASKGLQYAAPLNATLRCVQADDVQTGSKVPSSAPAGARSGGGLRFGVLVAVVGLAIVAL